MDNEQYELVLKYCRIGFCKPKFYKSSAWKRAEIVMNTLIALGYVKERRHHGQGRYWIIDTKHSIEDLAKIAYENGCRLTEVRLAKG